MVIDALCQHFHLPHPGLVTAPELPNASSAAYASPLDYYNPLVDSEALKKVAGGGCYSVTKGGEWTCNKYCGHDCGHCLGY